MENKNRLIDATAIITSFLCLCPMIYGIIMWNKLPELMPIHFDANGEPNNWGPRWVTVFFLPVFLAIINLVVNFSFYFKARQSGETVKSKFVYVIKWFIPVIALVIFFLVYSYSLGLILEIPKIVVLIISIMFIIMGNYLPKAENFLLNIKVKEENYTKVKRIIGWSFVIAGLLGMIMAFFKSGLWIFIGIIFILAIETIIVAVNANK